MAVQISIASAPPYGLLQHPSPFPTWLDPSARDQENGNLSLDTARRAFHRAVSSTSMLSSSDSVIVQPLRVRNENVVPSRTISLSTVDFNESLMRMPTSGKSAGRVSHKSSWGTDIPLPLQPGDLSVPEIVTDTLEDVDLGVHRSTANIMNNLANDYILGQSSRPRLSFASENEITAGGQVSSKEFSARSNAYKKSHPFRRWMSTIQRKNQRHQTKMRTRGERWPLEDFDEPQTTDTVLLQSPSHRRHKKSSSWASSGFVTAVKSASMSLATLSVAPHSRRTHGSSHVRSSNRSSRVSRSFNRPSTDEPSVASLIIDEASRDRATKRRRILEELVDSEESYVADLKVLVNVYFTLLATSTTTTHVKLTHIHENITDILVLHEDLLRCLREIIPHSSSSTAQSHTVNNLKVPRHRRRHSVNMPFVAQSQTSPFDVRRSLDSRKQSSTPDGVLVSDPKEAAKVASVFEEVMSKFFVYEEYGARYESMLCDMTLTTKNIPNWHSYERGIEALANTLAPVNIREGCNRKGLTFGDLLIKPIQRVCKYPLLFADLYKYLPVIDCPESHGEVEKTLFRLRETAMEINKATNDEEARERIQRSWHLQDLLVFPDPATAPFTLRSLGHPILCGILHVAYQTKLGVCGRYMLCALFGSCLIFGSPCESSRHYTVMASIGLGNVRIETADNGKGLQCHTAPYSWKIIFESEQQLFEVILSACSPPEETQWKDDITRLCAKESQDYFNHRPISHSQFSWLALDLKPLASILGQPGTLARRISVQRAATVGPRTNVCQVFIKNTHALKDSFDSTAANNLLVSRSQSLLSTNRIPVLAPKRIDRMRMEQDLAKVWTKELLPYPGMGALRGEHLFRASASSVMRKLSRASIASGFTKRSASFTSLTNSKFDEADEPDSMLKVLGECQEYGAVRPTIGQDTPEGKMCMHSRSESTGHVSLRRIIPPTRTSSRHGTRSKDSRGTRSGDINGSDEKKFAKGFPNVYTGASSGEKTLRNRWSSPISLIRSLSTEGMKHMFT